VARIGGTRIGVTRPRAANPPARPGGGGARRAAAACRAAPAARRSRCSRPRHLGPRHLGPRYLTPRYLTARYLTARCQTPGSFTPGSFTPGSFTPGYLTQVISRKPLQTNCAQTRSSPRTMVGKTDPMFLSSAKSAAWPKPFAWHQASAAGAPQSLFQCRQ